MADDTPLAVDDVLARERRALRPDGESADSPPLSALCISGGGIRSATFGLGVIQGLAERGILEKFDYLSTVSGGGYIGSWLTAWIHRAGGLAGVIPGLRRDAPKPGPGGADPVQHLREYNSYLSPHRGVFTTDVFTLAATVLRNILLNWMVLIPLLMFVLILPRLFLTLLAFPELIYRDVIFAVPARDYGAEVLDAVSTFPLVTPGLPVLALLSLATCFFFILRYLPGVGGQDHSRFAYVVGIVVPLVTSVLAFMAYNSLYYLGSTYTDVAPPGPLVLWILAVLVVAMVANLAVGPRPFGERVRLLFGPLPGAVLFMAAGTGFASWYTTNFLLYDVNPDQDLSWAAYVTVGPPLILAGFGLGTVLFVGLSSTFLQDEDREWMSRAMAGVLVVAVVWMALCGAVLVLPEWALDWRVWGHGLLGAATVAAGWLSTLGGKADAGQGHGGGGATSRLKATAGRLAPPVFIVLLAGALSVLTNVLLQGMHALAETPILSHQGQPVTWRDHYAILEGSHPIQLVLLAAVLLLVSWIMARYVNINTFSLHAMYRDRLIRAYLGASNRDREASPFTGFAPDDDIPMAALDPQRRPFHVVNLALNLVSGSRLAWQQRKADSFTVTPLHCGNAQLGFRPSAEYAGGITLGTAVALSGAAASPNMGYHSTPVVGFVMTLFNTRLGAWLGNPGAPGRRTWRLPGPLSAIGSLIKEALGQTSDRTPFVYLSDGGHFENLALYEMVRRGCRQIVVLDSGCDPEFRYDDLGNALRKIRIDLGVPITFADAHMQPLRDRERRCAVATVEYSKANPGAQDGVLIYLKPLLRGNESPDVASYAAGHPAFPHQTTADQWFDESQTESYRALGLHTVDEICRGWKGESLESLRDHIQEVYLARD